MDQALKVPCRPPLTFYKTCGLLVLLSVLTAGNASARSPDLDADLMEILVGHAASSDGESPLLEILEELRAHPIDLRKASGRELARIPGIGLAAAKAIRQNVLTIKKLSYDALFERLSLAWYQRKVLRLCTFIAVEAQPGKRKAPTLALRWRIQRRLEQTRGQRDSAFRGSPLAMYQRLSYRDSSLSVGLTSEKDAGEISLSDFMSAHAASSVGPLSFVLGDYYIQSGMGTLLWRSIGERKGSNVIAPALRSAHRLRPYRSSTEHGFFRGIAVQSSFAGHDDEFSVIAWYSHRSLAANLQDQDSGGNQRRIASSLHTSGYFRTAGEQAKRDALGERGAGASLAWTGQQWRLQLTALNLAYSHPLLSGSTSAFSGSEGTLLGGFAATTLGTTQLAAEAVRDARCNLGGRVGAQVRGKRLDAALSLRHYEAEFRSPFASVFGESSAAANESGLYLGLRWRAARGVSIQSYADFYRTPSKTFSVNAVVSGFDFLLEGRFAASGSTSLKTSLRYEDKTDATNVSDAVGRPQRIQFRKVRTALRAEIRHRLQTTIRLRSRADLVKVDFGATKAAEWGSLLLLELRWQPPSLPLRFSANVAYFATDSFNSAIWAYEPSLPGLLSVPALFHQGMRAGALLEIRASDCCSLWLNMSLTARNNIAESGSGLTAIDGGSDRRLRLAADLRW